MIDRDNTCTACFPAGSKPTCKVFDNSSSALIIYSGLHAANKTPSMCMQADRRYRVCHLQESAAACSPLPGLRAA